jgi:hypothetical protein
MFEVAIACRKSDASGSLWTGKPFHFTNWLPCHLDVIEIATNITVMTSRLYTDSGQLEIWDGLNFEESHKLTEDNGGR